MNYYPDQTPAELFAAVLEDLAIEMQPKCKCPEADQRNLDALNVVAVINGEEAVWALRLDDETPVANIVHLPQTA